MDNMVFETSRFPVPRTRFYQIAPIGRGGPYIESLNSYLKRLAYAHSVKVTTFLVQGVAPLTNIKFPYTICSKLSNKSSDLDVGKSDVTQDVIKVLEDSTKINHLSALTMHLWSNVFISDLMTKNHLAWCPICLNEMHSNNKVIYEPLLWRLEPVTACPIHECKLSSKCHNCDGEQSILNDNSIPGYCQYCGWFLGGKQAEPISETELRRQLKVTKDLSDLLIYGSTSKKPPDPSILRINFENLYQLEDKSPINSLFKKPSSIPKQTFYRYAHGEKPTLSDLLELSLFLGTTALKILSENKNFLLNQNERIKYTLNFVEGSLSVDEIARRSITTVPYLLANYSSEISEIFKNRKDLLLSNKKGIIRDTAEKLIAQGLVPSMESIEILLDDILFDNPELRDYWAEEIRSLQIQSSFTH